MDKVCVTTEILCDLLANKTEIVEQITKIEKTANIAVAPFVLFGLFCIAEASEKPTENTAAVWDLLHRMTLLEWTPEASEAAAKLFTGLQKAGKKTDLRDLFIGVLAVQNNYALFTTTPDVYKEIPGIKIYK